MTEANEAIVFDSSSGISLEEQQEILDGINAMAVGSRIAPEPITQKAKNKDYLFPLIINICALILLGLGTFMISFFYRSDEQNIREASAGLGHTERLLIQEIRQQTRNLIDEKDRQIDEIFSILSELNAESRSLQSSAETLSAEQSQRLAQLLRMHDEYSLLVRNLQDEKFMLIEESRTREAALHSHIEERSVELSAAMEELLRLHSDHERGTRIEQHMGGLYASANNQIRSGRLDEAHIILEQMRQFMDAPSLQGVHLLQTRRQSHLAAINALEIAVAGARSGQDSEQARIISGYQSSIGQMDLQMQAANDRIMEAENALAEQARENAALIQEVDALRRQSDELQTQIEAVRALLDE